MKKFLYMVLVISSVSYSLAQTTGVNSDTWIVLLNTSSVAQLQQQKDALLSWIDSSVSGLMMKLSILKQTYSTQGDYQMLQCLNLVNLSTLENTINQEIAALRNNVLNDYVTINSQIYNLENRKQLALVNDISYNTESSSILINISWYRQKFDSLLLALVSKYGQSIDSQGTLIQALIDQNKDLLAWLRKNYTLIQSGLNAFDIMQQWITKVNSVYVGNQESLNDVLVQSREKGVAQLQNNQGSLIKTTLENYKNMYDLPSLLQNRSNALIENYKSDFSSYFSQLTQGYYNQDDYNFVRFNINLIKSSYMSGDMLRCENILATNPLINIQDVVPKVLTKIQSINSGLKVSIEQLGINTSGIDTVKNFTNSLQDFHIKKSSEQIALLKKFSTDTLQSLMQKSSVQTQQWEEIQKIKSLYDKEKNSDKKAQLKEQLITLSKQLFSGVVLKTTRDSLIQLSQDVGFDYPSFAAKPLSVVNQSSSNSTITRIVTILSTLWKDQSNKQDFIDILKRAIERIDDTLLNPTASLKVIGVMQNIKKGIQQFLLTY